MLSHVFRLSVAVVGLMLAAASGSSAPAQQQQPPPQQGYQAPPQSAQQGSGEISSDDIVGWKAELDKPDSLAPAFASQARKYGCRTYNEDAWGVAAQCNEGIIIYKQENTTALIGCAKVTEQACRDLFSRIVNTP